MNSEQQAMRHSLAHIMAQAVQHLWPQAKFGVGPAIDQGFYYDIDLGDVTISEADFGKSRRRCGVLLRAIYPLHAAMCR